MYTEVEVQSTVPHLIEELLENSPKFTSELFFKNLLVNKGGGDGLFYIKAELYK